ncbi:MAG: TRAP transporter substrate-binding protein [Lachnotalea sp.]
MKKNKKIVLIFTILFVILASGCGKKTTIDQSDVQRYAWPLGTASPEDTVTQIYAQKFADEVERLSNGTMKIQVYPNSTIGGDVELLESCKAGDIPFVVQNTAPQVSFMPKIAIFDLPCAYQTIDEVRKAIDNEAFYSLIQDVYDKGGYKLLGYADQEFRVMTSNIKIEKLSDFKGIKIRTMENTYHIAFWNSLGANPTPMTFSEVYIGLQQGTIDAQENPYEVITSSKLYEQQKYVININHLPHLISLIVSDEFYQSLPIEKQMIIDEAAKTAKSYAREAADERVIEKKQAITASGTEIYDITEGLYQDIKEASSPVYDKIEEVAGEELVNTYLEAGK